MSKFIDLTGQKFGNLTAVKRLENNRHKCAMWECRCSCGKTAICTTGHLRSGHSKTCGCLKKEILTLRNVSHDKSKTPEYRTWYHMIQRCTNPNDKDFKHYGGRGIAVCPEWRSSFQAFYEYIGTRPTPQHSIDRIDNNIGYRPGNIKWATTTCQGNNRRTNRIVAYKGKAMNLTQWASEYGMSSRIIYQRVAILGWPIEKALTKPIQKHHIIV